LQIHNNKFQTHSLFALDINFVHHSWESDALTDVLFSGQPGDGSVARRSALAARRQKTDDGRQKTEEG
jgi:hypothetical protein